MTAGKKTIGQAIDEIISALNGIDEKDRSVALQVASTHLSLKLPSAIQPIKTPAVAQTTQQALPDSDNFKPPITMPTDIRSLKEEKQPTSAREMACIVAYYLQNVAPDLERKEQISSEDVTRYFKQAGFPLPRVIPQLLKDCKGAGYFDSGDRGSYKLNPVGYNLVAHGLPRTGTSGLRAKSTAKKITKKPNKTKTAKKKTATKSEKK